jgi:hypothetical protein
MVDLKADWPDKSHITDQIVTMPARRSPEGRRWFTLSPITPSPRLPAVVR